MYASCPHKTLVSLMRWRTWYGTNSFKERLAPYVVNHRYDNLNEYNNNLNGSNDNNNIHNNNIIYKDGDNIHNNDIIYKDGNSETKLLYKSIDQVQILV